MISKDNDNVKRPFILEVDYNPEKLIYHDSEDGDNDRFFLLEMEFYCEGTKG